MASAPSAMKIKRLLRQARIVLTPAPCASGAPELLSLPKVNELLDGNIFAVDAKRLRVCTVGFGGEPQKTACSRVRGAARSRTLQEGPSVCGGWW